jgi:hypothetical protein
MQGLILERDLVRGILEIRSHFLALEFQMGHESPHFLLYRIEVALTV